MIPPPRFISSQTKKIILNLKNYDEKKQNVNEKVNCRIRTRAFFLFYIDEICILLFILM